MRAPANMPAAPQPFEPAGLGPSTQSGDVNLQSMINPLASSDVGGTAGHDAAACVSARGKCDGASVCNARDARVLISPTTRPARQVVAPQLWVVSRVSCVVCRGRGCGSWVVVVVVVVVVGRGRGRGRLVVGRGLCVVVVCRGMVVDRGSCESWSSVVVVGRGSWDVGRRSWLWIVDRGRSSVVDRRSWWVVVVGCWT